MARDRIFVSYRRKDARASAARLIDDLRDYFGRDRVYRDIDSNRAGQDYVDQIREALAGSQVVVVVLGRDWISAVDDKGTPRLSQADDPIRLELEVAFAEDVALIPVLVEGATMPQKRDLPTSIERFARIHACRMSDDDWEYDFGRLLETFEAHGVIARRLISGPESTITTSEKAPAKSRYERTLQGSRRRVYDALAATVEALGYRIVHEDVRAATIIFQPRSAGARETTAKVIDESPGRCLLVVELVKVSTGGIAATFGAAGLMTAGAGFLAGLAAWPAIRVWEESYATGLIDNVQALLEGRGLGKDSALLPGVDSWRNRSKKV